MSRISLSALIVTVLFLTAGAPPAGATWSAQNDAIPGAAAAAGFRGKLYIFARNADNSLKYRTGDGRTYSGWTPLGGLSPSYPAAATATDGTFIAVFHRGTDNVLYVSRTYDGTNYESWRPLDGNLRVSAAPSAVGFNGRIHVFVRGTDNTLYTRYSINALNWSNWFSLGGQLTGAPVATVMRRADGQSQIVVLVRNAADSKLYHRTSTDGTSPGSFTDWYMRSHTTLSINPNDQADFPIVTDLGFNFISPNDPDGSWESYKLPVFLTAQAQLAKFNLFFDSTFPNPVFSASHIQDAIDRGAVTIILRLAETKISHLDVDQQLNTYLLNSNQRVLDVIAANPYRQFWIEVGNEPNLHYCMSPREVRNQLLATIENVASKYRATHPNMRWMASLPTRHGFKKPEGCWLDELEEWKGLNYLDIVLSDSGRDGRGSILSGPFEYDAVGIHMFGSTTLQQEFPLDTKNGFYCTGNPDVAGDPDCPTVVLDRVLAKTSKTIFITEAGINNADLPWHFVDPNQPGKATLHIRAMRRLPAQVRGFVVWAADLDRRWCDPSHPEFEGLYSFDATYQVGSYCTVDPDLGGSKRFNAR